MLVVDAGNPVIEQAILILSVSVNVTFICFF